MFAMWRHLLNNVVLVVAQVRCARRVASSALPANDGMFSRTLQTFKHRFLCVICSELLHSYHNCNVDPFFATDEQFQYGMNVDFNRLTNAHFRHSS